MVLIDNLGGNIEIPLSVVNLMKISLIPTEMNLRKLLDIDLHFRRQIANLNSGQ